jgi:hypothetical protein
MTAATEKQTDNRLAKAWYILYPLDAYAIGPYRYRQFVSAERAVEDAKTNPSDARSTWASRSSP